MMVSAHLLALLAAATCSGVCQYLSRALMSAECFRRRLSAFCQGKNIRLRLSLDEVLLQKKKVLTSEKIALCYEQEEFNIKKVCKT